MANSFKNSYFYIGYIRRVFLSLLLCFSFGLTAELHSTLIENLEKSNEILDRLKISKKQKEDILNSLKALKENENELNELNTLSLCVENGDIKCAEKSIEKYPKLLSYKIHPYVSLLTATLIPHVDFDEKMFDFLVSKGHRIYGDDDMLPFFLLQNEAVSDEKCLEIIKKMRDDGMDLGIKMPYFDRSLDIVALDYYKPKTAAYILKNGQKSQFFNDFPLQIAIGHIMVFFRENNAGFEINLKNLKATPKSIELSKSEKYKKFIDKEFEILKVYLEANGDEKFIAEIEKIFTELNDKESLEKLEKLGYKLKK
ncbi:MAG: hypothetical protein SOY61_05290, partial [Campylobacter sp.]|nr:hypothetical protein [Campylobacter sp.]